MAKCDVDVLHYIPAKYFFWHDENFEVWEQLLFEIFKRSYFPDKRALPAHVSTNFFNQFQLSSCFQQAVPMYKV